MFLKIIQNDNGLIAMVYKGSVVATMVNGESVEDIKIKVNKEIDYRESNLIYIDDFEVRSMYIDGINIYKKLLNLL